MQPADRTPGRRMPDHIWIAIAVIADVSALVATARSNIEFIIVVSGVGALLAGIYRLAVRWGQPVDWRIALATITMIAGSGALIVVVDRSLAAGQRPSIGSSAAGDQDRGAGTIGAGPTRQSDSPATPTLGPSPTSTPSASTGTLSLLDADVVSVRDGIARFVTGPLKIDTVSYDRVLYGTSTCQNEPVAITYQLDRKYRKFHATVGVGDDTEYAEQVKFALLVDGSVKHNVIADLGETIPFEADITGAFRITIHTQGLATTCGGRKVYGGWIDPVVTP